MNLSGSPTNISSISDATIDPQTELLPSSNEELQSTQRVTISQRSKGSLTTQSNKVTPMTSGRR